METVLEIRMTELGLKEKALFTLRLLMKELRVTRSKGRYYPRKRQFFACIYENCRLQMQLVKTLVIYVVYLEFQRIGF